VGVHKSELIGKDLNEISNNLIPYISQVDADRLEIFSVFGGGYDTHNSTVVVVR
jgi:UDP-glucose 4-epimerase